MATPTTGLRFKNELFDDKRCMEFAGVTFATDDWNMVGDTFCNQNDADLKTLGSIFVTIQGNYHHHHEYCIIPIGACTRNFIKGCCQRCMSQLTLSQGRKKQKQSRRWRELLKQLKNAGQISNGIHKFLSHAYELSNKAVHEVDITAQGLPPMLDAVLFLAVVTASSLKLMLRNSATLLKWMQEKDPDNAEWVTLRQPNAEEKEKMLSNPPCTLMPWTDNSPDRLGWNVAADADLEHPGGRMNETQRQILLRKWQTPLLRPEVLRNQIFFQLKKKLVPLGRAINTATAAMIIGIWNTMLETDDLLRLLSQWEGGLAFQENVLLALAVFQDEGDLFVEKAVLEARLRRMFVFNDKLRQVVPDQWLLNPDVASAHLLEGMSPLDASYLIWDDVAIIKKASAFLSDALIHLHAVTRLGKPRVKAIEFDSNEEQPVAIATMLLELIEVASRRRGEVAGNTNPLVRVTKRLNRLCTHVGLCDAQGSVPLEVLHRHVAFLLDRVPSRKRARVVRGWLLVKAINGGMRGSDLARIDRLLQKMECNNLRALLLGLDMQNINAMTGAVEKYAANKEFCNAILYLFQPELFSCLAPPLYYIPDCVHGSD